MSQKIVVVEDDINIAELLRLCLEKDGFAVSVAHDGGAGVELFEKEKPDLVMLDIMLPVMDGWAVLKQIRKAGKTPVIMLTAKGEVEDKVNGLESGADDYIVKPFSSREVVARVKAVLRRFNQLEEEPAQIVRYGGLEININNYDVRLNGERLPLTPKEVEIFQLLASHPGKVFSREKILSLVWGYDYFGDTRAVDTQIKRIRQKLPQEETGWAIKTVYGVGYRFEVYNDEASNNN